MQLFLPGCNLQGERLGLVELGEELQHFGVGRGGPLAAISAVVLLTLLQRWRSVDTAFHLLVRWGRSLVVPYRWLSTWFMDLKMGAEREKLHFNPGTSLLFYFAIIIIVVVVIERERKLLCHGPVCWHFTFYFSRIIMSCAALSELILMNRKFQLAVTMARERERAKTSREQRADGLIIYYVYLFIFSQQFRPCTR
jgi:hypothetical protein